MAKIGLRYSVQVSKHYGGYKGVGGQMGMHSFSEHANMPEAKRSAAGYVRAYPRDEVLIYDSKTKRVTTVQQLKEGNPAAGVRAQIRRLPTGQIQIKIPLKLGRRGNPVSKFVAQKTAGYNVYLRGKWIDKVFFSGYDTTEEVKRSLVNHDGYDPGITVRRERKSKNPVHIEQANGDKLAAGIRKLESYGDSLLRLGNNPKMVAEAVRHALGNRVQSAVVIADDGKGGRAYNPQDKYEVIVGNIGSVHSGRELKKAIRVFNEYAEQSQGDYGRAAGEDVTLMRDGEPYKEYYGSRSKENPRGRGKCNPSRGSADSVSARELELFVDNDAALYRQQYQPILKNLATKKARGIYDHAKAVKLFMYLMESGAKKYAKEYGGPGANWHEMFNVPTRMAAAESFTDSFETEYGYGNYDNYLPKKYQKK